MASTGSCMANEIQLPTEAPWERLTEQGENSLWHGYFLTFRDMGPTPTLFDAYRIELQRQEREDKDRISGDWHEKAGQEWESITE
jgi:hypothetical protein